jgi:hypothetical protein
MVMRTRINIAFTRTLNLLSRMYKGVSDNGTENFDILRSGLEVFAKSIRFGYAYVLFFVPFTLYRNSLTTPSPFT